MSAGINVSAAAAGDPMPFNSIRLFLTLLPFPFKDKLAGFKINTDHVDYHNGA